MAVNIRRKVLITGAAGGMGRACANLFGGTHDLVLTDVRHDRLDPFAQELRDAGCTVMALAGDMLSEEHLNTLAGELAGDRPFSVIHAAGLSPSLADWLTIMKVNLVASEMLMNALEPALVEGSVVIPIASLAGHLMPVIPEIDALLVDPLNDGFVQGIGATIEGMVSGDAAMMGGISYSLSKRGVQLLTVRKANAWGPRGVRVVSISPGVIHTPMGLSENEKTPGAADTMHAAPLGRIGTPMDIAMTARFLCSDEAGYITGYHAAVDERRIGFPVTVFVSVALHKQSDGDLRAFENACLTWPLVRECYMISGEADYHLRCVAPDLETFEQFLRNTLSATPNVASVKTQVTIRPTKREAGVPLEVARPAR